MIEVKNYITNIGLSAKTAYLAITYISYHIPSKVVNFSVSVFSDSGLTKTLENNIIYGYLENVDLDKDLISSLEDILESKIEIAAIKTQEECEEHNAEVTNWVDLWEPWYAKFISNESSDDDDYIEAAKIMLGE